MFFFEIRFSHTPPNKQISSIKIFLQTTDQIKIPPFIIQIELVTEKRQETAALMDNGGKREIHSDEGGRKKKN